jgi:hypothetical protein
LASAAALGLGLLQSSAIAQGSQPDYFAGAEDAAPLTAADAQSPPPPQAEVLRWKAPRTIVNPYVDRKVVKASITLAAPQHGDESGGNEPQQVQRPPARASSGSWNKTPIAGHQGATRPVRLAAHDPFTDPFGDRQAQNEEPDLSAPMDEPETVFIGQQPPAPDAGELPAPAQETEQPPMPMDGSRDYDPERCRKWQEGCRDLRDRLAADKITSISLNITPPYSISPREGEDPSEHRRQELALTPSRDWRSKTGALLATGRLGNVEFGRVTIIDDSGNEIARLELRELGRDEFCFITHHWQVPYHCYADLQPVPRNWMASTFTYQASNLCHKPLYFEEVQLERYGHTAGPIKQPLLSGAHFFGNIAVLPYKMAISPPMECEYALGYYRPGSCAPWHIPPIPFSVRGALAEAGVWIGGIYLIP